MKLVIQRVKMGLVKVDSKTTGKIGRGYVVLTGFKKSDTKENVNLLAKKLLNLRIMADDNMKMNKSILEKKGEILLVSQFTLYGNSKKGNRPSFINAMEPKKAKMLFNYFVEKVKQSKLKVETGEFGEMMELKLINDGPTTIILKN